MPQHRFVLGSAALAVCAFAAAAAADDAEAAREFRRAEMLETAFGDLKRAAESYRSAAEKSTDAAQRARAALREGSCLRRLGKVDEAKALLAPLASGDSVPDEIRRAAAAELDATSAASASPPAPQEPRPADRRRVADMEHELELLGAQLDAALQREQGLTRETEKLSKQVRQKDGEIGAMRSQIEPASAEEALRARIEERERRRQTDRRLSRNYAAYARRLHQEGRFGEARDFVNIALEKDPENAEAKALSTLVSAPLGVRERLYEAILGVLALSREVAGQRTAAEIDALVAEARRRQDRDEFAPSVVPLERALALIESGSAYLHDADASRESVLALLRAAQAHGARRSPPAPPSPPDDADARGLAAVRELLSSAGAEVSSGLLLRFHDAGPALAAASAGLPPAALSAAPEGWTISAGSDAAAPLLVEYLRACDPQGFAVPGASAEAAGSTIVALCDADAQRRLADRVTGLTDVTAPAADLSIAAYRLVPGEMGAFLESRGIRVRATSGGRVAVVSAADADAIARGIGKRAEVWPSVAALRAATLRPFRLAAGTASASLAVDLLPVTRPSAGLALRVAVESEPAGRADGARLRQETTAGALLDAGAALVVFGVADPADPSRDLAVVVREGTAPAVAAPAPPPAAPGLSSSEMLLPASLRGLVEVGPEPIVVPGHVVPSRTEAIAARLGKFARGVEVTSDRIRVVGSDEARAAARKFLDQVDVVRGVQAFDVAVYEISQNVEQGLLADLPRMERRPGEAFARAVVRADERKYVERALAGTKGRLPLLESRVSAPPTGRADAAYVVRSSYRRDLETSPGQEASWGRSETQIADEGVLVAIRPFGRRETGRTDFDVSLRAAWVADRGERTRDTALGRVTTLEPILATWAGDLPSTTLGDEELLVVAGLANPFAAGSDRPRLVVTIANARPR